MTEQEFDYDFERCKTLEDRHEVIESYWREYEKKNEASKFWPNMDYDDSFIIPVPWHTSCGLDWDEYYDPCIVIDSDYDDGGL